MKIISSFVTTLSLLLAYALLLAVATFIEKQYGSVTARELIYNNYGFYLLQLLMAVNFIAVATKLLRQKSKKIGMLIFHFAFIVILIGAWVTATFSTEGVIHLREGETTSTMLIVKPGMQPGMDQSQTFALPFQITLNDFKLLRYPGSQSPSAYESHVLISGAEGKRTETVSMNKVVQEAGYRLYQSSFDKDEQGTVLTVNHDVAGSTITYTGYFILLVGILWVLLGRSSRFAMLNRQLKALTGNRLKTPTGNRLKTGAGMLLILLAVNSAPAHSQTNTPPLVTVNEAHARQCGKLLVQCASGRIEPMDTYATKLLRKLYRDDTYNGLSGTQVILGIVANPEQWQHEPVIRIGNEEIHTLLGDATKGKYLSFGALFDDEGHYKLATPLQTLYEKPARQRTKLEKDLLKLDERVNIFYALQQGEMLNILPLKDDPNHKWYTPGEDLSAFSGRDSLFASKIFSWYMQELVEAEHTGNYAPAQEVVDMLHTYQRAQAHQSLINEGRIEAELWYNRLNLFAHASKAYLMVGVALLLLLIFSTLYPDHRRWKWFGRVFICLPVLVFAVHTAGIGLRWYISGQAPWSNAYESMIYVAWAAALGGLLFIRRSPLTLSLATILAGVILFVTNLNSMDPEITPLVPVLQSYWLMIHVAVITASYGFFGISFLIGILTIGTLAVNKSTSLMKQKLQELRIINEMCITIGLCLLTAGTFIGAIWANESWGRYWGWDPKETWALITMIVYALVLHVRLIPRFNTMLTFSILSVYALSAVLMTYFGVNYYLAGLHSYGSTEAPVAVHLLIGLYLLITLVVARVVYRNRRLPQ
ncbi:cytochrome c biogenesis protein CcsA [Bacteroides sp.]|uniref:cytochrome c biogenesis protein CcsA n=2 Tax=Bacteroides sp. TaxID=29523 RepID=UPI001B42C609|nr:cytochrome c biogenesis protein CcsA [Bacteroides sp.]MBP6065214.1 cytochrome c biogenesis protein CcsA [Bacteroides sp.]MBP6936905.1 cytochrome c biogenesis protein CcsA [Bacteroides sp.]MBP8622386.1 cytochrome c biogenesis protein CcsA [Bacteroides sp.]MBP9506312.1 cytochrome c biogenesis protein CcsA [Bacteroides sp.]